MPKITNISQQKNNPNRYNLFLDERFYCGVDLETIGALSLKIGLEISEGQKENIFRRSEISKLYQKSLDFIATRPRSEKEVKDRVREKTRKAKLEIEGDELEGVVDSIVERLLKLDYLNDEAFAQWWITQRTEAKKPSGWVKIRSELLQKGVSSKVTEKVWLEFGVDEQELVERYFEQIKGRYDLSSPKGKKKLTDHLLRRGFNWEKARGVVE